MLVVVPTLAGDGVLRVKEVRRRRVVNDQDVLDVPPKPAHVLLGGVRRDRASVSP